MALVSDHLTPENDYPSHNKTLASLPTSSRKTLCTEMVRSGWAVLQVAPLAPGSTSYLATL